MKVKTQKGDWPPEKKGKKERPLTPADFLLHARLKVGIGGVEDV